MIDSADLAAQLAALREQYAKGLAATMDALVGRVTGQGADIAHETLVELHAALHKLAGSGGTFGFPELSRKAHELEVALKVWLDNASTPDSRQWEDWKAGLLALPKTIEGAEISGVERVRQDTVRMPLPDKRIRIVLIEDDQAAGFVLSKGLNQFGYEVAHYTMYAEAELAILKDPPDLLVVDIMLSGQPFENGTDAVKQLFSLLGYSLPTVFITARTDFSARLATAKAEGGAFLTKPVDIPALAGRIEMLQREREIEPYRVLIVDDDEALSEHYRLTLSAAGMLAEKICQPKDVLTSMQELRPDILLIDLYMPECTGAELARAIRYDDAWLGTPIIYLSGENELGEQIKALDSGGGDDFLTKPISDSRLVAMVRTRAARARKVAEMMSKDSLTGLLKHSSIKERMVQELERAHRHGQTMTIAMVDMDHFKQVNDTWGHPMGDQVIKTLAHLLRQRLRRQDSIGRYGGEEFAVVLPECNATDAMQLLDDVRQRFAEVRFIHKGQSFAVTLSAGVASSDQCSDAQSLLAASDKALYVAKESGRNQVRRFDDIADGRLL